MNWYEGRTDAFAKEAARRAGLLPEGYRWATADETELHQNGGSKGHIPDAIWVTDRGLAVPK